MPDDTTIDGRSFGDSQGHNVTVRLLGKHGVGEGGAATEVPWFGHFEVTFTGSAGEVPGTVPAEVAMMGWDDAQWRARYAECLREYAEVVELGGRQWRMEWRGTVSTSATDPTPILYFAFVDVSDPSREIPGKVPGVGSLDEIPYHQRLQLLRSLLD